MSLTGLMAVTRGRADVVIALLDGPVAIDHEDLTAGNIRVIGESSHDSRSAACRHGTFVAGILAARPGSPAPGIAADCTILSRPLFDDAGGTSATPAELASAIVDCVDAGASVINISAALKGGTTDADRAALLAVLHYAAARRVLVVAAAGNHSTLAGSVIISHPWVIPVAGCAVSGQPLPQSNLGQSVGRHGLAAPGEGVISLVPDGPPATFAGTSVAAPFVSATAALLLSAFPAASAVDIRNALLAQASRRRSVVPPLLNAARAHALLAAPFERSAVS
ncbi:S8 family serine peptidase [Streptomyces sp. NPDC088921]|uniref:S8 family peptidase n=1 Tax=unclassified Streptomyces TaxID=2593676 RepID=UPI00343D9502